MSKRSFLKPVALVAASLAVSAGNAHVPADDTSVAKTTESAPKQIIETPANPLDDFIISAAEPALVMAAHSSHASHSSHSSHSSHASSSY